MLNFGGAQYSLQMFLPGDILLQMPSDAWHVGDAFFTRDFLRDRKHLAKTQKQQKERLGSDYTLRIWICIISEYHTYILYLIIYTLLISYSTCLYSLSPFSSFLFQVCVWSLVQWLCWTMWTFSIVLSYDSFETDSNKILKARGLVRLLLYGHPTVPADWSTITTHKYTLGCPPSQ